ncbi:MAG: hypothetical protein V4484_12340 [Pseudomonadota bacterium]
MNKLLLALLATLLTACAAPQQERMGTIAATPLTDLNLNESVIPAILVQAKATPYAAPADQACPALMAQVLLLDDVLGPDLDVPEVADESGTGARAVSTLGNAAVGAVQRTVEGAIPFRGWLRKLSGAERHSRDVATAITAGTVRRGYLKGVAFARDCSGVSPGNRTRAHL